MNDMQDEYKKNLCTVIKSFKIKNQGCSLVCEYPAVLAAYPLRPPLAAGGRGGVGGGATEAADEDVGHVGGADLGAGHVHPGAAEGALDHGPPPERLHAVARDQLPRLALCNHKRKCKEKG